MSIPWEPARREQLGELYAQGLSLSRLAKEMGVSRSAIAGQVARLGLNSQRKSAAVAHTDEARAKRSRSAQVKYSETSERSARAFTNGKSKNAALAKAQPPSPAKQSALTGMMAAAPAGVPREPFRRRDPPPLTCEPVSILDLREGMCRWVTEQRGDDGLALWCGPATEIGRSFCGAHHALAHQPARGRVAA